VSCTHTPHTLKHISTQPEDWNLRWQAHDDRNEARKLTPSERREKKLTKLIGEAGPDTLVAVYRVGPNAAAALRAHIPAH
jgi:hypothetical protein